MKNVEEVGLGAGPAVPAPTWSLYGPVKSPMPTVGVMTLNGPVPYMIIGGYIYILTLPLGGCSVWVPGQQGNLSNASAAAWISNDPRWGKYITGYDSSGRLVIQCLLGGTAPVPSFVFQATCVAAGPAPTVSVVPQPVIAPAPVYAPPVYGGGSGNGTVSPHTFQHALAGVFDSFPARPRV